jgi:hypothetical protein
MTDKYDHIEPFGLRGVALSFVEKDHKSGFINRNRNEVISNTLKLFSLLFFKIYHIIPVGLFGMHSKFLKKSHICEQYM